MPAPPTPDILALRGRVVTFRDNPFTTDPVAALHHEEDGLLIIRDGRIAQMGTYADTLRHLPADTQVTHYPDCVISAGFVDTHVHYPQLPMIAAYGEQLLEWLERYTFPTESRFRDPAYARDIARRFLAGLLRCGTTTAAVFCTVHPQSVEAFFSESERLNTLMIAGKVLMDRNAPPDLRDTAQRGYDESLALMTRWHGRGRQMYAVTPRFAPTSSEEQLELAGALLARDQTVFMQTHLAENLDEVAWVRSLFPARRSYLDVYAHAGLVRPRAIMGHAIHVDEPDLMTCHDSGCALAHCPTSNLFLGSGSFRLFDALDPRRPVRVGLGTDIGAGTSLSQLQSLNEAYKVAQGTGHRLHPVQAFWLATAGGAQALHLDHRIGTIAPGMEADLCILDPEATPLQALRAQSCDSISDLLFSLMMLGDDRSIRATYVAGRRVHERA
ncbi:guanine deaminase [Novacetimonas hansenii]|uniref:Guanine deaminase n=2 Tax=Novacetimonas hansenii TaxID=436 RepID=A0ABQ0SGA3_NOVHA|nr:guanine deaminase [Novacetimonas hansenii]EFG83774.1 guanine deaminase [Novacetimonas hansenii ATCC 23769]GAN84871.1 guanine deaminase [Novacetimonas hansenii JCM 7643]GBQ58773.1 guanine deaminase [Novacetimonas hansenii NRIC 0243]GEC64351.1 guanine deaminase [Novacetimonas hansenii]